MYVLIQLLVAKEEETIKMINFSVCEVIDTRTVNVICKDVTVRALEAIRYAQKARYNLISIGVLDKKRMSARHG